MMTCDHNQEQLGVFLDGELSRERAARLAEHLARCPTCRFELEALQLLTDELSRSSPAQVPTELWSSIERRLTELDSRRRQRIPRLLHFVPRFRFAAAATFVLATGLTLLGLLSREPTAAAAEIDFGVLLDEIRFDAREAFVKFVAQHDGKPTTPSQARRFAPRLNFNTPDQLPGGFELQEVFTLRIGTHPVIAARYQRNGEFLHAVFHPPTCRERFGTHKNCPCVIGQQCGHKVQVGDWKLVHLTDPTTCHCVLSRLDEQRELPAVLNALAAAPAVE